MAYEQADAEIPLLRFRKEIPPGDRSCSFHGCANEAEREMHWSEGWITPICEVCAVKYAEALRPRHPN